MDHLKYNLKFLRKEAKKTQRRVSNDLKMDEKRLSNYENIGKNNREPDYDTLLQLADYYGVSVDDLLRKDISVERIKERYAGKIAELQADFTTLIYESEEWKEYKERTAKKQRWQSDEPDYDAIAEEFETDRSFWGNSEELAAGMTLEDAIANINDCREKLLDGKYNRLYELFYKYYLYDTIAGIDFTSRGGYTKFWLDDLKEIIVFSAIAYDSIVAELTEFYNLVIKEVGNET